MYYPYLRGKQFELLMVRELCQMPDVKDYIVPIIEPVNPKTRSLEKAIEVLEATNTKYCIIVNPLVGDIDTKIINLIDTLTPIATHALFGILIDNDFTHYLSKTLKKSTNNIVAIGYDHSTWTSDIIEEINTCERVTHILHSDASRRVRRKAEGKKMVLFGDYFIKAKNNGNYIHNQDECFSEDYFFYRDEGYDGIADYTTLTSSFISGGVLPNNLAFHLTYCNSDEDEVRIYHFVSTRDSSGPENIHGKFEEVMRSVESFYKKTPSCYHSEALQELLSLGEEGNEHYPGLGALKKLSMKHHIELIVDIIKKRK